MESTRANKRFRFLALAAAVALALPAGATAAQITGGTSSPGGGSGSSSGGSDSSGGGSGSLSGGSGSSGGGSGSSSGGQPANQTPATKPPVKGKNKSKAKKAPRQPAVAISSARCVPASSCSTKEHEVSTHGTLLLQGKGLKNGQAVAFPHSWDARIASNSPSAHLHSSSQGLVVTVPSNAHSGEIAVTLGKGRKSNLYGPIKVVTHALHPPAPPKPAPAPVASGVASTANGTALAGQGMWIWYLSASGGGKVASIAAQAKAAGVGTLLIKSSDGSTNYWSQFSKKLVEEVHAQGLKVCAWQYVYGTNPVGEAELGRRPPPKGQNAW